MINGYYRCWTAAPTGPMTHAFTHMGNFSMSVMTWPSFLVACFATLHPALLVGPSVRPSVRHTLLFFVFFCGLWPHCSCPSDQVTSYTAPAHLHANGVAVYPALLSSYLILPFYSAFILHVLRLSSYQPGDINSAD